MNACSSRLLCRALATLERLCWDHAQPLRQGLQQTYLGWVAGETARGAP